MRNVLVTAFAMARIGAPTLATSPGCEQGEERRRRERLALTNVELERLAALALAEEQNAIPTAAARAAVFHASLERWERALSRPYEAICDQIERLAYAAEQHCRAKLAEDQARAVIRGMSV